MTLPNSNPQTPKQKKHTGRLLTNMAQDTGFGYPRAKDAKQHHKGRKRLINLEWSFESQMFNQRLARICRWGCSEW